METALLIAGGVGGLAGGIGLGLYVGGLIQNRASWVYWTLNAVLVVAGIGLVFVGLTLGASWLVAGALGLEGGGLTGLKYGYGRSVGLWATHDRITGVSGSAEER